MSESLVEKIRNLGKQSESSAYGDGRFDACETCADLVEERDAKIRKLIQRCLDQKIYPTECFNGILALLGQPEESTR